ncbi:MAG: hypothetical protein M3158_10470 [Pseudomonadota bacterium]|nr:hypothetical protein [Pseudomonadota bacterium]
MRELERREPTAPDFLVEEVRLDAAAARCVPFELLRPPDLEPDRADLEPDLVAPFAAVLRPADFVAPPRLDVRADLLPDDRLEDFDADLVPERADDREADFVPDFDAALPPPDRVDFEADLVPDFAALLVPDFEDLEADLVPDFFAPLLAPLLEPLDFAPLFFAPVDALFLDDVPLRARPPRVLLPAPDAEPPVLLSSCMVFDLSSVAIIASFKDPRVPTVTLDQGNVIIWSRFRKWISR